MRKVSFTFKRFDITDVHCGHKVGTDGVLLGAWADTSDTKTILDIGCGSGLISLMMAQRTNAQITAVEIDADAINDARNNFEASAWSNRITLVNDDFKNFKPSRTVDLIICNPPFFHETLRSPDQKRANARHEGGLNYRTLIEYAKENLSKSGRLSFIYSPLQSDEIIYHAEMRHLKLRRHCLLRQKAGSEVIRELYEFSPTDGAIVFENLAIRGSDNEYTTHFFELTKEFYL